MEKWQGRKTASILVKKIVNSSLLVRVRSASAPPTSD